MVYLVEAVSGIAACHKNTAKWTMMTTTLQTQIL